MTGYVYLRSEPGLWTVGYYTPAGQWVSESDHGSREDAANRVNWLNGGYRVEDVGPSHRPNDGEHFGDIPTDDELYREAGK